MEFGAEWRSTAKYEKLNEELFDRQSSEEGVRESWWRSVTAGVAQGSVITPICF